MTKPESLDQWVTQIRPAYELQLSQLVAVPTVSADPLHQADIARGAKLAAELFEKAGLKAEIVPTSGNPVVVGTVVQNPEFPTVTLYNHFDVQPADPGNWHTPPFELKVTGDNYFGRGATDDKGPALAALTAVKYAVEHKTPVNLIVIWELEEEIGSPHFEEFMQANALKLKTDVAVVSDTMWESRDAPAITYGLRGLITFELHIKTALEDAHSGSVGGAARNPIGELAQAISQCYDAATGEVRIPGFYDAVHPPTPAEMDGFLRSGFSVDHFKSAHQLLSLRTSEPKDVLERIMAKPTFEVHGIVGGYTGPGVKTVVPPQATAKLSARLVPGQDPQAMFDLIKTFITNRHPDIEVTLEAAAAPYLGDFEGAYAEAARTAMQAAFGAEPVFLREGGSIGAVLSLRRHLKAPVVMMGLSLPEHGYHAPNEHFDWRQAAGGVVMFATFFEAVAAMSNLPAAK